VPFRGTVSKRTAALGSAALIAGATLAVLGVLAPSAEASTTAAYNCTLHTDIPVLSGLPFSMPMDISGTLPNSVQQGDDVTLAGFQTVGHVQGSLPTILATLGATSVSGSYNSFDINASIGDASLPPAQPSMPIAETTPSGGAFDMVAPATPTDLTFHASNSGTLTVTAAANISGTLTFDSLTGSNTVPFDCTGVATPIASTTVKDKPKPPPSTPPGHSSSHPTPPGQDESQPAGLSNGSPSSIAPTPTPSATASGTSAHSHPQLAKTGFSQAAQLSVGGALLILVGGGLMFAAWRREPHDA
jgi:hypothetical protein